jgi:hypothetical protein
MIEIWLKNANLSIITLRARPANGKGVMKRLLILGGTGDGEGYLR